MLGEQCESLDVPPRGVVGDRLFAIREMHGKFGSGKSTRRFRQIDGLFGFRALYDGDVPVIRFPDGQTVRGDHPDIHTALSTTLGQPVTLAREASIAHLDACPIHMLTTASLAWLRALVPEANADARRFRPNLVIDVPGAMQVERGWLGKRLCVGEAVQLRVSAATERCAMVAFAQAEVPYDARILRCITQEAALHFGVYADVLVSGRITRGDSIIGPNLAKPQKLAQSTQGDSPTGLEHAPKVRFSYFTTRFASIPPRVRRGLAASTVKTSQFGGYANSPGAQRAIWCTIVCMTERFFAGFCLRTTYLAKKSPFARFGPIMAATDCHQRNYVERDSRCI